MKLLKFSLKKISIMYILNLFPFESVKSFEQMFFEYHYSITFQWPFFFQCLING
jgi:hypothetical protein